MSLLRGAVPVATLLDQWHIRIVNVVDVLIAVFLIYWLLLLIRRTRAVQLVKGLLILLVAKAISNKLGLQAVNWLLSQAITALIVALPVVFQPELRRALESIGRGRLFTGPLLKLGEGDVSRVVEEIMRAIDMLRRERIGALLVMERRTGLEEYVAAGVRLDAALSAELLFNIFVPRTPLHDGAVIIRGDRVAAAGCFLPLSDDACPGRELGTRHRAGLGISEQSDAVAVIISEETGMVSLAVEGVLLRDLDEGGLRARLLGLLRVPQAHVGRRLRWRI